MSRYHSYLRSTISILGNYSGDVPLSVYLKQYFSEHKKFGSSDRREVSSLCYSYFRTGHLLDSLAPEERIISADFLCRGAASTLVKQLKPDWHGFSSFELPEKSESIGLSFSTATHTPWFALLQQETNPFLYACSMLKQPALFARIRPGRKQFAENKLKAAYIDFEWMGENCIKLPNGTKLQDVLTLNRDVVIQDFNSQNCGSIIKKKIPEIKGTLWDACAASGGKSILLSDIYKDGFKLFVSDIRASILHNLRQRFQEAGISCSKAFVADLSNRFKPPYPGFLADVIIADVPCSGSGTWARTPEMHYFFQPDTLPAYTERQLKICENVLPYLKNGGYLIYITCSVFTAENEEIVRALLQSGTMILFHQQVLDGTLQHSDSMFVAILQKN